MASEVFDVLIIGAGAAGLMASIAAGERFQKENVTDAHVRLLDSQTKIGAKILVSGGGRCNVTNQHVDASRFNTTNPDRSPKSFISRILRSFSVEETHRFFDRIGVPLKLEPEMGKYFPVENSSRVVLKALLEASHHAGAELVIGCTVNSIQARDDDEGKRLWVVDTAQSELLTKAVVLCTGGLALPKSGSNGRGFAFAQALGHSLVTTTPALTPLLANPAIHASLSGITLPARITLRHGDKTLSSHSGSFLFTHVGYSGPPALNISRHFARFRLNHPNEQAKVTLRLLPEVHDGEEGRWWHEFVQKNAKKTVANALTGLLPRRVAESIEEFAKAGDSPLGRLSREMQNHVKSALFDWSLPITGVADYVKAETTAGGIPLDEIESASMMSKLQPGLFFAGEICDVDGWLGGYNFQWAWSSGTVAGRSAARYAMKW